MASSYEPLTLAQEIEFALMWATELESGNYQQGAGMLRSMLDHYCCLGVKCTMLAQLGLGTWKPHKPEPEVEERFQFCDFLPHSKCDDAMPTRGIEKRFPFLSQIYRMLAARNDKGASFKEIALIIRGIVAGLIISIPVQDRLSLGIPAITKSSPKMSDLGEEPLPEQEIELCPDCGRLQCICDTEFVGYTIELEDEAEQERYLDKRLSDREDFHSDDARFSSYDELYIPEF